ncbi:MAG: tRNA uridine-5-carboxymethylaminomethyl(34) synthesis GTPase MnmE [Deltaproteobacteria bacterium]
MNSVITIDDTIAAISTPFGNGGISIIRISGEKAFEIIEKVFKPAKASEKNIKTYSMKYGHIVDSFSQQTIDEVLVSFFVKPNTYTREDIAEINCHGGIIIAKEILGKVVEHGARLAEPGEFTMRAFINGRVDLLQAEAVIDLINSKTIASKKASLRQLEGKLSNKVREIREKLVDIITDIEATIDYPEYDIEEVSRKRIEESLNYYIADIEKLLKTYFQGRILREGIEAAIIGRPNVGKSSLLNALAKKEKAIITDIPGTTRDVIEEYMEIGGIAVKILDTAGLRETTDKIEMAGIERSKKAIEEADLTLLIFDGSQELKQEDKKILELLKDKKTIVIINKIDLERKLSIEEVQELIPDRKIIEISAVNEEGLENIEQAMQEMIASNQISYDNEILITNLRHKNLIEEAKKFLEEAKSLIQKGVPVDIVSVVISEAAGKIGEITGDTVGEEVIRNIFSKFCVGK